MNLRYLFASLALPSSGERQYAAIPIPKFPYVRIAKDSHNNPALLFAFGDSLGSSRVPNTRLKHIQLLPDASCEVADGTHSRTERLTILSFQSDDADLRNHFLFVAQSLIQSLGDNPSTATVISSLSRFLKIFQLLSATASKEVQGLWAELVLIELSRFPETLIKYWHSIPESKFDFASGDENIEVKSTTTFQRMHSFSHEQLVDSPSLTMIASIFVLPTSSGLNLYELVERISRRLSDDSEARSKLHSLVFSTLGSSLESVGNLRFDYSVAIESLRFYNSRDVPKIATKDIPAGVRSLKYVSDLTSSEPLDLLELENKGPLLSAVSV